VKNYAEMTGFEINKAVAELEGLDCNVRQFFNESGLKLNAVRTTTGYKNYLVNWSEAGPIIARERISLMAPNTGDYYQKWDSHGPDSDGYCQSDLNPLRAAMITFLMMHDHD